ncbi:MAG: hypothetical protein HY821_19460 [Acidobacteria bacterium]|nr:hypothetical protein [Acidobacteriota bacterium]
MRTVAVLLLSSLCLFGQTAPLPAGAQKLAAATQSDVILRAALEELSRARNLRSLGEPTYYADVSIDDAESFSIGAMLGSAFAPQYARLRPVRVSVRVGGPNFDNTNSLYSDYYSGSRYDSGSLPIENSYFNLRQSLWLSFDIAYKTAFEALGRKAAALRGVSNSAPLNDFWDAPGRIQIEDPRRDRMDEAAWTTRVKALSAIFTRYPAVTSSVVDFEASQGTFYFANSLGTVVRTPDRIGMVRVRASLQAPDGMVLYDGTSVESLDPAHMPADSVLAAAVEGVAQNLDALAKAPVGEAYVGPVLFLGTASAQIFGEILGTHLSASRRPVSEPGRAVPWPVSDFDGRIGSRVLPEWMDVTDDPTIAVNGKTPLLGAYDADLEGLFPTRVNLVENGVLKALLTTRQPVRGMSAPNGRARLPGMLGVKTARPSNLFVTVRQTDTDAQLKERLLKLIANQGKPYGILVRKMDFPSAGSVDELRRVSLRASRTGAGGRAVSSPILVYRVYPDGREELVRGLRFRGLAARNFKDILAAGSESYQFDYVDNGAPMAISGGGSYIVGCSVIAPSVLFEDLEMDGPDDDQPKPPVVPAPSAASLTSAAANK